MALAVNLPYRCNEITYRNIKNYLGQRWSWIGKCQPISCDDFFGTNNWPQHKVNFLEYQANYTKTCQKFTLL
jgi:hypothetical protein